MLRKKYLKTSMVKSIFYLPKQKFFSDEKMSFLKTKCLSLELTLKIVFYFCFKCSNVSEDIILILNFTDFFLTRKSCLRRSLLMESIEIHFFLRLYLFPGDQFVCLFVFFQKILSLFSGHLNINLLLNQGLYKIQKQKYQSWFNELYQYMTFFS